MRSANEPVGAPDPIQEPTSRVSRRAFLKAGGAGMVAGAAAASVLFEESVAYAQQRWDMEADVVVAGSGGAAFAAAIFAAEAKASVIMLEKALVLGGTTAKSGGIFWIPNHPLLRQEGIVDKREDFLAYAARTSYPTQYNPADKVRFGMSEETHQLLAAFYDHGAPTVEALMQMGLKCHIWYRGANQQAPDYFAHLPENKTPRGRGIEPTEVDGVQSGASLIKQLKGIAEQRKVRIFTDHRVSRLVVNSAGEVVGVEATTEGRTIAVRARKGVIFGTGGFTANPELCLQYLRGPIFGGCAVPTNEGDLIPMAAAVRAQLGNMSHAWWSSVLVEQALQSRSTVGNAAPSGDSMVTVDCTGRRCVNEKLQYAERTQSHFEWDGVNGRYPAHLQIIVYDQSCRERFGGTSGTIVRPGLNAPYVVQGDTLEELQKAVEERLAKIAHRTGNFRVDADWAANLQTTIERFNEFAKTGKDLDFHRGETPIQQLGGARGNTFPNPTMKPISDKGPYYATFIGGGTLDTKGGPKIDVNGQMLNVDNKPIPGLYGAGNCIAAPAGQSYWAGGATIGSAIVFGRLGARHAVASRVKEPHVLRA